MTEIIISILLLIGTFIVISGSLGILRFPDVYTRLHAATKASTLGVASILLAAFLFMYFDAEIVSGKLILGIIFILLTAPVSGHMISRAAHNSGVRLWEGSVKDDFDENKESMKNH
ncbi:monovalent cation/H(+) antiporter subunit G [Salinibacillus xinjiangensis]|uniref:Na+/H+ antiporter subunit G n=1 Tax=Salinibacillus xinjiangensis TaxID=1229268 RepID=A0A6G1X6Z1_9BACI|nr:monovalent cation/H(+) antiporter subunit G [Salinibacillus xinjiangensis]MRG86675.1 Na+/H+ antiporter subunit G [Salinibacillus xinjiangensis]